MDDEMIRPSVEGERDEELAEEMRRLHPLLQRQRRAASAAMDAGFKRALLAQLTSSPRAGPAQGAATAWHTLIAMLLPSVPQLSLRGDGPQLVTYTAGDVTISLTARPADGPTGGLISLYGEVDYSTVDHEEPAEATVAALCGETILASTALDNLGNFVLQDLPPRVYALRLRFPDQREIIIPPAGYDAEGEMRFE